MCRHYLIEDLRVDLRQMEQFINVDLESLDDYAERYKGAARISPKELLSTGRGRKLGFLPSYHEWTVLTTLTPATGQVGFLGHSSSSFRPLFPK